MNKVFNQRYEETYYEEILPNGLDVIVWHKPKFTTTSCIFAAPYGSLDCGQIDAASNHYQFPPGIAHFLEHKLFESDHGDVMNDFSRLGASVNAFTGYGETVYYFSTSAQQIAEPLNLLLDFVQQLSITDESVEKEKGIICQELAMYQQMPDSRQVFETMKAMYQNHPLKYDIGGSPETVQATSRRQLEDCYRINYHPANMMLVIVTPQDPAQTMQIVRRNQAGKQFVPPVKVQRFLAEEPLAVCREETVVHMDVSDPRVCLGIKLPVPAESDHERVSREWALHMTLDAYFSSLNPDYQTWLDQQQITPYFSYEADLGKDYGMLLFLDESPDPHAFASFIRQQLTRCLQQPIRAQDLRQLKHRAIGENMTLFNKPAEISIGFFHDRMNGVSLFENFDLIETLTPEQCSRLVSALDVSHQTLTIIQHA